MGFNIVVVLFETVVACGHENITARHRTTIEVTMDPEVTLQGDCIIGVGASMGICDLSPEFMSLARQEDSVIKAVFKVGDFEEIVTGHGHPDLSFTNRTDFVLRKSDFICPRTLMIGADRASVDLGRDFVDSLKKGDCGIEMCLYVSSEEG